MSHAETTNDPPVDTNSNFTFATPGATAGFTHFGMTHSADIGKLAEALAKAQAEIQNPGFDSTNPHYGSKYASLAATLNCVREACSKHGLSFIQPACNNGAQYGCQTMLMHSSGQWVRSELLMTPERPNVHGAMGALTYARRGAIQAMFGIHVDLDDDGNAAIEKAKTDVDPVRGVPPLDRVDDPGPAPTVPTPEVSHKKATMIAFRDWTGAEPEDIGGLILRVFKAEKMRKVGETYSEKQWKKLTSIAVDALHAGVSLPDKYPAPAPGPPGDQQ